MKLEYKRELDHNYLILEEQKEAVYEGYEIYMLEENQIPGLLKCRMQRLDQQQRFCYDVTSRQPLDIILERKRLVYEDLRGLLRGIYRALLGAREYLLDVNGLILLPEYIYVNLDTNLPELCYFPYYEKPIQEQFFELTEYLLGKLDRQDRAGVELGYEIYKMASEENCSIEEIINIREKKQKEHADFADKIHLSWEEPEPAHPPVKKIAESGQGYGAKEAEIQGKDIKKRWFWEKRKKNGREKAVHTQEQKLLSGDEVLVEMQESEEERGAVLGETSLLSDTQRKRLVLYGANPAVEALTVRGDSFLIGKREGIVDGRIDHPTVSRIHAKIEKREQSYYLTDLNSTNGTFLNDRLLEVNETVPLNIGDAVRFADVEYVVGT